MMTTFFISILGMMLLSDAVWWLWADRVARRARRPRLWRAAVATWGGLMLGYLLWVIAFPHAARQAHAWLPRWSLAAIYIWHLLVAPASVACIFGGTICRAIAGLFTRMTARSTNRRSIHELSEAMKVEESEQPKWTRRQALNALALVTPPIVTGGAVAIALRQMDHFRLRRIDVALPQLPPALDGLRIAQVSDTHIGRFTRPGMLPKISDAVNALKADLVFFAGDLIDLALMDLPAGIDFMRSLDPRGGLFMVEGNHDLIENPEAFESRVKAAGLPLLLDESTTARVRGVDIQILGLTWRRGDAGLVAAVSRLIPQLRPDHFQILLAHHPHAFDPAADLSIPLTLSGHTHGGQLMLNEKLGAGPMMFRYWSGLYRKRDSSLVVSNGVGNWFPLRINAPAEIVEVTLRRA